MFGMYYHLMALFLVCSNFDPQLKWPQPGAYEFFIGKSYKIFFSETAKPRALIFGMYYHLMALYLVCSNYDPRAKKWPHPGAYKFFIGKSLKIFFSETS